MSAAVLYRSWQQTRDRRRGIRGQDRCAQPQPRWQAGTNASADLDGDGTNRNAGLTVFRHFDSATVVQGFVGGSPETAWIVGYPLLERIHYLLVAGYDVYGRVGHQLTTRLYMDFLRMEGESNFLALLPMASRDGVRDQW